MSSWQRWCLWGSSFFMDALGVMAIIEGRDLIVVALCFGLGFVEIVLADLKLPHEVR